MFFCTSHLYQPRILYLEKLSLKRKRGRLSQTHKNRGNSLPADLPYKICWKKIFREKEKIIAQKEKVIGKGCSSELHKGRKKIEEGRNEDKIKSFLLLLNWSEKGLFLKGIIGTMYWCWPHQDNKMDDIAQAWEGKEPGPRDATSPRTQNHSKRLHRDSNPDSFDPSSMPFSLHENLS